jgi:hypothetical protein
MSKRAASVPDEQRLMTPCRHLTDSREQLSTDLVATGEPCADRTDTTA